MTTLGLKTDGMKTEAMVLRSHGGPEVLQRETVDLGTLCAHEARIRVRAVALNHLDLWIREGLPAIKLEYPHRLGADVVGEIEALGAEVTRWKLGDRVLVAPGRSCGICERCALGEDNLCAEYKILGENTQGGYARHIHLPSANLIPYPQSLSWTQAAAVPLVFLTAWQMVVRRAQITPGQVVLIQAAGSGVSSAAIQIAKLLGARVFATTGSDEKAERARALGADEVINYATHDFVKECKHLTAKRGVDVVLDHVGGEVFAQSILAARWGGKVVTCGSTAGFLTEIDLRQVFFRQIQILGSTMGPRGDLFRIVELIEQGKLRPVVDRVLPLWDAGEAHRVLEKRQTFGKVVLEVD